MPKRSPSVPMSSWRSDQTTISDTKPPPATHWVKPTIVIVRMPACRQR